MRANVTYHSNPLTEEYVDGILGDSTDTNRGRKILGGKKREAILHRIKFMEESLEKGLVQKLHIPTAVRTITSLKAML